ncbi:MAG: hypothetical protein DRN17_04480 [Thermoplasmata archaeon]|nr:MAG: hypothetical protein DRN17_04480 [Thermoplasmata archaeon]
MKAVSLLSGGIDSPVALYIMAKKADCMALHMDNSPFGGNGKKVVELVDHISDKIGKKIELYSVPFGEIVQKEIYEQCEERYRCVMCKRMMYRVAEEIGRNEGAEIIVTGENLGQVASQTLQNLMVLEKSVSMPVVRPLIGLDKEEIIDIAKRIGTYELSIKKSKPCTLVPSKPATSATLESIKKEEEKMGAADIIRKAVREARIEKL